MSDFEDYGWWSLEDLFPGEAAGLQELHELVPAAEERDLLDEALEAEFIEYARIWYLDEDEPEEPDPADEIVTLLKQTFGAIVIADNG